MGADVKYNLEHRHEISRECSSITVMVCTMALFIILMGVIFFRAFSFAVECGREQLTELRAFYPDPVCETCGAVMDGTEHRCDEPSALTLLTD